MPIRNVRKSDIPSLIEIVKKMKKWFEPDVPVRIKSSFKNMNGYVFTERGKVVGFILYKIWKKTAEIKWFAVNEIKHSRGIGTRLYKKMENDMKRKRISDITVTTLASTVSYKPYRSTRRFYNNKGFKKIRIDKKYWKKKYDRLVLIKEL